MTLAAGIHRFDFHSPGADGELGKIAVLVTDGQLPYPYGREMSGYEVANLADTVSKAKATGATILVDLYTADRRQAAIILRRSEESAPTAPARCPRGAVA